MVKQPSSNYFTDRYKCIDYVLQKNKSYEDLKKKALQKREQTKLDPELNALTKSMIDVSIKLIENHDKDGFIVLYWIIRFYEDQCEKNPGVNINNLLLPIPDTFADYFPKSMMDYKGFDTDAMTAIKKVYKVASKKNN